VRPPVRDAGSFFDDPYLPVLPKHRPDATAFAHSGPSEKPRRSADVRRRGQLRQLSKPASVTRRSEPLSLPAGFGTPDNHAKARRIKDSWRGPKRHRLHFLLSEYVQTDRKSKRQKAQKIHSGATLMDCKYNTIIEPFRIKVVEPLPMLTARERAVALERAHYNLFALPARTVTFDLLTDSGTSAMSARQWAAIMEGDESYAGSLSFERFERAVQDLTGMEFVIPTHQGRSAEYLLMKCLCAEAWRLPPHLHPSR